MISVTLKEIILFWILILIYIAFSVGDMYFTLILHREHKGIELNPLIGNTNLERNLLLHTLGSAVVLFSIFLINFTTFVYFCAFLTGGRGVAIAFNADQLELTSMSKEERKRYFNKVKEKEEEIEVGDFDSVKMVEMFEDILNEDGNLQYR